MVIGQNIKVVSFDNVSLTETGKNRSKKEHALMPPLKKEGVDRLSKVDEMRSSRRGAVVNESD